MMRFLSIGLLALSLFIGAMGVSAPTALAQQSTCSPGQTWNEDIGCITILPDAPPSTGSNTGGENADGDNPTGYSGSVIGEMGWIMGTIMSWFAWLVGMAALILDYCVYFTVLTMGTYINNLSAIGMTWSIIRDIGNIALIFGFLMVGISTILGSNFYGGGQKLIPALIIVAVSLNFSLFVAEAVIDTGNLFASQFYTQINGGEPASVRPFSDALDLNATTEGISSVILGQLSLQRLYGDALNKPEVFSEETPMFVALMAIILFMVTAFVMLSLAFTLVARFVILIFVIITSPIGFIGFAIPPLESKAKEWWKTLMNQTLTAPIMMLMLYVALRVITDVNFLTGFCTSPSDANEGGCGGYLGWIGSEQADLASTGSMLLSFLVAMGLLLAVNMIAKSLSAWGAGWATSTAGKLAFGLPAWGMRRTVGAGANKTSKYLSGTWVGRTPIVGTGLVKGLSGVAGSSFDARGVKTLSGIKGAGITGSDAQKGGYKAELKAATESRVKYAESLHGHELEGEDKIRQVAYQNELKDLKKQRGKATSVEAVKKLDVQIKAVEKDLEELEAHTDAGVRRSYAKVLNLGLSKDSFFNKYINSASNTEAAKKILKAAKESPDDKALAAAIKKAAGGEDDHDKAPAAPKSEVSHDAPSAPAAPAGGASHDAAH